MPAVPPKSAAPAAAPKPKVFEIDIPNPFDCLSDLLAGKVFEGAEAAAPEAPAAPVVPVETPAPAVKGTPANAQPIVINQTFKSSKRAPTTSSSGTEAAPAATGSEAGAGAPAGK